MSISGIETAGQWAAEFSDESMVVDPEVSKLESKSDEM
jgi:hypothetical protein